MKFAKDDVVKSIATGRMGIVLNNGNAIPWLVTVLHPPRNGDTLSTKINGLSLLVYHASDLDDVSEEESVLFKL